MAHQPVVVVFGSINIDLVCTVERFPKPGETITGGNFKMTPGGKGANQAVAAARMGAVTCMVGRVGKDIFGARLLAGLRGHGVDVGRVTEDSDNASGVAIIQLDSSGQNQIVVIPGANGAFDEIQLAALDNALRGADILMLQNEVPFEITVRAARTAKMRGVRVVWDPAPPRPMSDDVMALIDVLTPNQTETGFLTGICIDDKSSAREAVQALLVRGAAAVVVKLGELGAYFASSSERGCVQAFKVPVVDTVAAGDAFNGALAVTLAEGMSLGEAVRWGAAAGALAVTRPGAQEAMPDRAEVEALLNKH